MKDLPRTSADLSWLSDDERRYLAMHARYASAHQEDPRYWDPDRAKRERLRVRWREIADALYGDPWGPERPLDERIADAVSKATANPGTTVEADS